MTHRPILSTLLISSFCVSGCLVLKDVGSEGDDESGDADASSSASSTTDDADGSSSTSSGTSGTSGSTTSSGNPTTDEGSTTDDGSLDDTGFGDPAACENSGGTWHFDTCGHWTCGQQAPAVCDPPEPGCECGPTQSFESGVGCVEDPVCTGTDPESLCEQSGGDWDATACGHYACGLPNECQAAIPGCNCGGFMNFAEGEGCVSDAACGGGIDIGEVCDPEAPNCVSGAVCCYPCGIQGCDWLCEAEDPGRPGECPMPPPGSP